MARIVIYGATSAIAEEAARSCAARGDTLCLIGRNAARLTAVADDLAVRGAAHVLTAVLDFEDLELHAASVADAQRQLGGIDAALIAHGVLDLEANGDPAALAHLMHVNFVSAASLALRLGQAMRAAGGGTLVVLSSVAAERGRRSNFGYGASKAALNVFLQGLRAELAPAGVRVVTAKLGPTRTPMLRHRPAPPLVASARRVGRGVARLLHRPRDEAYLPALWGAVMWVVRALPEWLAKRLRW